jgi:hypothetical protein
MMAAHTIRSFSAILHHGGAAGNGYPGRCGRAAIVTLYGGASLQTFFRILHRALQNEMLRLQSAEQQRVEAG